MTTADATTPVTHHLVLVRHSKAAHMAPTDIERPLTATGQDMARELADMLSKRLRHSDSVLASPATRARQTAEPLAQALTDTELRIEPSIYHGGPEDMLSLLQSLDDDLRTVVLVGHEPTISTMGSWLADPTDRSCANISFGVPTATALLLSFTGPWSRLEPGHAHLDEVVTAPR